MIKLIRQLTGLALYPQLEYWAIQWTWLLLVAALLQSTQCVDAAVEGGRTAHNHVSLAKPCSLLGST